MIEKKKRENNGLWRLVRSLKFNRLAHIQKGNDAHSGANRIICLIWEININSQNFDYCIRKIVHLKKAFNWLSLASMIHPIIQLLLLRLENCFRKSEQLQFCDLMCYVDRGRLNVPKSKYYEETPHQAGYHRLISEYCSKYTVNIELWFWHFNYYSRRWSQTAQLYHIQAVCSFLLWYFGLPFSSSKRSAKPNWTAAKWCVRNHNCIMESLFVTIITAADCFCTWRIVIIWPVWNRIVIVPFIYQNHAEITVRLMLKFKHQICVCMCWTKLACEFNHKILYTLETWASLMLTYQTDVINGSLFFIYRRNIIGGQSGITNP